MTQTLTQSVVITTPITTNESFYLERFKRKVVEGHWLTNGRLVDSDYSCELYKGFAIVTWKREFSTPTHGVTKTKYESFVWEVGTYLDNLEDLGWLSQGCVTTGWGAPTLDKALVKVRKKIDLLSLIYADKEQLRALSITYGRRIGYDEPHVFNATVGDIVLIRAFGRNRLGKVVATIGSRFIVAYMTPSNSVDVHYKTLPLNYLFPKETTP